MRLRITNRPMGVFGRHRVPQTPPLKRLSLSRVMNPEESLWEASSAAAATAAMYRRFASKDKKTQDVIAGSEFYIMTYVISILSGYVRKIVPWAFLGATALHAINAPFKPSVAQLNHESRGVPVGAQLRGRRDRRHVSPPGGRRLPDRGRPRRDRAIPRRRRSQVRVCDVCAG